MPLLFAEDGSNTSARNLGFKNMSIFYFIFGLCLFIAISMWLVYYGIIEWISESNSLTLIGQYTVYNYTTDDGTFKIFLLGKERLNQSIILTNENDITEKILVTRIPYS